MKNKTGIGFRIIFMAVLLSVIAAGIGFVGLYTTKKTSELAVTMYEKDLLGVKYADSMALFMDSSIKDLLIANRPGKTLEEIKGYKEKFSEICNSLEDAIEKYEPTESTEEEKTLIKAIKADEKEFFDKGLVMFDYSMKGNLTGANEYIDTVLAPLGNKKLTPAIDRLLKISTTSGEAAYVEAERVAALSVRIIIIAILAGLAFSLVLAITITKSITKPVSKVVGNLSDSSGQIAISSTQLSSSSQEIANGAQEQAASIEETTSSMEELSSMVKQNLGNTRQASLLSEKATEASQTGFEKMTAMLSAMNGISKSAEDIRNVIDVIDDIAFQTNMLALNAAVEAARAGEAGMGFAVVADEVKNLANRSSESAKETAAMIKETLKNVESGLSISKELSEIFKEILTNSKKVMEMNREVETASGQQDEGISQVNKALVQFDAVVQANASGAEETASAAEELQGQVSNLNEIVDVLYVIVTGKDYTGEQSGRNTASVHRSGDSPKIRQKIVPSASSHTVGSHTSLKKTVSGNSGSTGGRAASGASASADTDSLQKAAGKKTENGTGEHTISFEDDEEFKPS